jgi:hypothetical protein
VLQERKMVRPSLPKSIRLTIDFTSSTSNHVPPGASANSLSSWRKANPLQKHATEALKKRKIVVKEEQHRAHEGRQAPPSKLNGSPNKKRGDSISKGKTKKGAKYK